jgi:hypothetical protein
LLYELSHEKRLRRGYQAEGDRLRQQLAEMRLERDDKELAWQECLTMRETENGWRQAAEAERDRLRQQLAEARSELIVGPFEC